MADNSSSTKVIYCKVCGFPPEYCEFGAMRKKCEGWLMENHKDLYEKLYSQEALESKLKTMEIDSKVATKIAKQEQKIQKEIIKQEARDE
ncbi:hypothetical protein BB560_005848, partial [Smittium megazygosporum]